MDKIGKLVFFLFLAETRSLQKTMHVYIFKIERCLIKKFTTVNRKHQIRICEILQVKKTTDGNTYAIYLIQKIIDTCNNVRGEELQNIYRSTIRRIHLYIRD